MRQRESSTWNSSFVRGRISAESASARGHCSLSSQRIDVQPIPIIGKNVSNLEMFLRIEGQKRPDNCFSAISKLVPPLAHKPPPHAVAQGAVSGLAKSHSSPIESSFFGPRGGRLSRTNNVHPRSRATTSIQDRAAKRKSRKLTGNTSLKHNRALLL